MHFRPILVTSILLSLIPVVAAAQSAKLTLPDLSALSKKASETVNISLDPSVLGFASAVLGSGSGGPALKDVTAGLQGIYVRSYKFDADDGYSKADVDAVRAQLVAPAWVPFSAIRPDLRGLQVPTAQAYGRNRAWSRAYR